MTRLITLVLLFISCFELRAQENPSLVSVQIDKFFKFYPQEKCVLISDNTTYLKRERIWFKIYNWTLLSDVIVTQNLNVVIRNSRGIIVKSALVLVVNGQADGDFFISDDLTSGLYSLEVHSEWMKNFSKAPLASRLIVISDVADMTPGIKFAAGNPKVVAEGGNLSAGRLNSIGYFLGNLAQPAGLEVIHHNRVIYKDQVTAPVGFVKILIEEIGDYTVKIIAADGQEYLRTFQTNAPVINIVNHTSNKLSGVIQQVLEKDKFTLVACTDNQFLKEISFYDRKFEFDLFPLPKGYVYLLLVDNGVIVSTRAFYNYQGTTTDKDFIAGLSSQPGDETGTVKKVLYKNENLKLIDLYFVIPKNSHSGYYSLDQYSECDNKIPVDDLMLFHEFPLSQSIGRFLQEGDLDLTYGAANWLPVLMNDTAVYTGALEFVLSEVDKKEKIDSIIDNRAVINRIANTYHQAEPKPRAIPYDETYQPEDFPTIQNAEEFVEMAIPRLKTKYNGDQKEYYFFYTNLTRQKQLYDKPAVLIVNGYRLENFLLLKTLPKKSIERISVIYNSKTLLDHKMQRFFPFGAVILTVTDDNFIRKIASEYNLFWKPFSWPNDFKTAGNPVIDKQNTRIPYVTALYYWDVTSVFENKKETLELTIPDRKFVPTITYMFSLEGAKQNSFTRTTN